MLLRLLTGCASLLLAVPAQAQDTHICWIDRVEAEGSGVRIFFTKGAPVASDEKGAFAEFGATLTPSNSGHDGCTITVARSGQEIGVKAEAHFFAPGITPTPEIRSEWIAATARP